MAIVHARVDERLIHGQVAMVLSLIHICTMQSMRDTVNSWDNNRSNTRQLKKAEKQITSGAQQAYIGYETMRKNITTLEKMVEL